MVDRTTVRGTTQFDPTDTGHAEVVQVKFDPAIVSYTKLLGYFFAMHDPTTLNRQGNDKGTQYRSAIFYHSEAQQQAALAAIATAQQAFGSPIVTEVTKASKFWPAEGYHQGCCTIEWTS